MSERLSDSMANRKADGPIERLVYAHYAGLAGMGGEGTYIPGQVVEKVMGEGLLVSLCFDSDIRFDDKAHERLRGITASLLFQNISPEDRAAAVHAFSILATAYFERRLAAFVAPSSAKVESRMYSLYEIDVPRRLNDIELGGGPYSAYRGSFTNVELAIKLMREDFRALYVDGKNPLLVMSYRGEDGIYELKHTVTGTEARMRAYARNLDMAFRTPVTT